MYPFLANSKEATKLEDKIDLFNILLSLNFGIKFNKFVHSVTSPKIPFNLCIASSTEYNSEKVMLKWLAFSSFWIIDEYERSKSNNVDEYVILYLTFSPSDEPP